MSSATLSPDLKRIIRSEAQRLGFELAGFTSPSTPDHYPAFDTWLNAGRHGEMAYLATDNARVRRQYPLQVLPECHTLLLLAIPYSVPGSTPAPVGPHGQVAAYAWGSDYHDELPARLRALVAFIEAQVGSAVPNRWYTDTGPILERDLAQRAGLGWIGKNTCLINPRRGSYFLLAEILLGLELEPDPPFAADHCGSCTRCIQACPTGCILPDRTLDASRCISYLTIELKGSIPIKLRPKLGSWIFGCDICQQVCPWNQRFASPTGEAAFEPRPDLPQPHLSSELALTPEAFNHKFKGSPLRRAKRRGYLRNVAVALGNSGDPAAVPALIEACIHDPEPLVRAHAAWALGRLGGVQARLGLELAAQSETDTATCEEIHLAQQALAKP